MSSPTSLLHLNPSTASEIQFFASSIIEEVKAGNESPLRVLVQLKAMEKASKHILEALREEIVTAAEKYPGKDFEIWGNKLEKGEFGISYAYETSGDIEWEQRNTDFETAKRRLYERQEFLRKLKEPLTAVNPDTGEVYEIRPPQKTSTTGVKVTIQ
jgi:hypothetical protein